MIYPLILIQPVLCRHFITTENTMRLVRFIFQPMLSMDLILPVVLIDMQALQIRKAFSGSRLH